MATAIVGGGERYVGKTAVSLEGETVVSVRVPAGANAARINPQLFSSSDGMVLLARDAEPTLGANELMMGSGDVCMDCYRPGTEIQFRLVDFMTGADMAGGEHDYIVVVFYTNIAGRRSGGA